MSNEKNKRPRLAMSNLSQLSIESMKSLINENQEGFKRPYVKFKKEFHVDVSVPENSENGASIPKVKGKFLTGKLHDVTHLQSDKKLRLMLLGPNLLEEGKNHFFFRDIPYKSPEEKSSNLSSGSDNDKNTSF